MQARIISRDIDPFQGPGRGGPWGLDRLGYVPRVHKAQRLLGLVLWAFLAAALASLRG